MENTHKLDLRLVLGVLALACAAMTIWAATALAGGTSTAEPATDPAAAFVQNEGEEEESPLPLPGDCPERDGEGEGEGDSGSSDAGGSDL